jgi:hypothetical protein
MLDKDTTYKDLGEYQDRRDSSKIDCSKTIWILATNAMDSTIQTFCQMHDKSIFVDDNPHEKLRLARLLSKELKQDFLSQFGVSLHCNAQSWQLSNCGTRLPSQAAFLTFSHSSLSLLGSKPSLPTSRF